MKLCNQLSKEDLEKKWRNKNYQWVAISFYKYAKIGNPSFFRDYLYSNWQTMDVLGRVYVAHEGINAQICLPKQHLDKFRSELYDIAFLFGVRLNIAVDSGTDDIPFLKLKIKVRNKILADGLNDSTFDVTNKGKHLTAREFNELTDDPNTLLIDFRNHYESEVGHFKGATTPDVDNFRESLPYIEEKYLRGNEDKNVVMYCTGGIRCEKASAWFKHRGFKNVHQLEGGIIKYANDCKKEQIPNKFIGKNFVFDERRVEQISNDIIAHCHQCGAPADIHVNCANQACNLLFIQCPSCQEKMNTCCSDDCIHIASLPMEEQKMLRKGKVYSNKIFKKGRSTNLVYKTNNEKPADLITDIQINESA